MKRLNTRGVVFLEYALLFALVLGAFVAIQTYAKRGLQARVKSGTDAMTGLTATITGSEGSADFKALSQYEPYYQEQFYETYQENVEQQHMGAGRVKLEKVSDVTARAADGSQKQRTAKGVDDRQATADALWE